MLKLAVFVACAVFCYAASPKIIGDAHPCGLKDYACIKKNLAANSNCNLKTRPIRTSYTVPKHRFEVPHFNASCVDYNLQISGQHRCYVSQFYFNVNGDSGVLAINCPYLNFVSDRAFYQHCALKEDSVYKYRINGTYPMITLTMTLYNADRLDICKEFTFASVDGLPRYWIDPKDRKTNNFLARDLTLLNVFERETFLYRANLLIREFINTHLCDFGFRLSPIAHLCREIVADRSSFAMTCSLYDKRNRSLTFKSETLTCGVALPTYRDSTDRSDASYISALSLPFRSN